MALFGFLKLRTLAKIDTYVKFDFMSFVLRPVAVSVTDVFDSSEGVPRSRAANVNFSVLPAFSAFDDSIRPKLSTESESAAEPAPTIS